MASRQKLIVVGNGMAGVATVEELLKRTAELFEITIFGAENQPNYNRVLLSSYLAGESGRDELVLNSREWYEENQIKLQTGVTVTNIEIDSKTVVTNTGSSHTFDRLVLATGSEALLPPIRGLKKSGVFSFRSLADAEAMINQAPAARKAIVIGGGLLGLEAARGLACRGVEVSVAHLTDRLMERQLDHAAAGLLRREITSLGIQVLLGYTAESIVGDDCVQGIRFSNGSFYEADLVVIATGIRPKVELARQAGIQIKRGIVVDDYMETSEPGIFAVGECCEHRGRLYGLVAPLKEQAAVAAGALLGERQVAYQGSMLSTRLKIAGVPLVSMGEPSDQGKPEELIYSDPGSSIYRKLVVNEGRLESAILVGDLEGEHRFRELIRSGENIGEQRRTLLTGAGTPRASIESLADDAIICGCQGVSKGDIVQAIREFKLTDLEGVSARTRACTSCKGCTPLINQILAAELGGAYKEDTAVICNCLPLSWEDARAEIKALGLKSVSSVLHTLGNGAGCAACKPALSYMLAELWLDDYEKERSALFINDRFHANIQNDGSFSVVPRIYGGVVTPQQLRTIADVAEKYEVPMVKLTGGQRIALLGIAGNDLPAVWRDLDMPSGHAYAKAVRTCKTCVGDAFCHFGVQDSISLGIEMEKRYQGIPCPAKVKMGASGCPRNCAESDVKDIGVIGIQGGWEIYVGGNGGVNSRIGDPLGVVKSKAEVFRIADAFIQYYRQNAHKAERTSVFVERLGIEHLKSVIFADEKGHVKFLTRRMDKLSAAYRDPWAESLAHDTSYFEEIVVDLEQPELVQAGKGSNE